jgi:hypothetical protein
MSWHAFCTSERNVKPLYIELPNGELQLMCQMSDDPDPSFLEACEDAGFKIVRIKHEVNQLRDDETALYYECHVKVNGPWMKNIAMISRNLYRAGRWYITRRLESPFDGQQFSDLCRLRLDKSKYQKFDGFEYEIVVEDTNPDLDARWF